MVLPLSVKKKCTALFIPINKFHQFYWGESYPNPTMSNPKANTDQINETCDTQAMSLTCLL